MVIFKKIKISITKILHAISVSNPILTINCIEIIPVKAITN